MEEETSHVLIVKLARDMDVEIINKNSFEDLDTLIRFVFIYVG